MQVAEEMERLIRERTISDRRSLREMLAPLEIEHSESWAWANYERMVCHLAEATCAKRMIEIGGGRDPLFGRQALAQIGAELTVNDISPRELAALPKGYRTACFYISGEISDEDIARTGSDLDSYRIVCTTLT